MKGIGKDRNKNRSAQKDLESTIVYTTVQHKNVKHPHDAHLMEDARKKYSEALQEFRNKFEQRRTQKNTS